MKKILILLFVAVSFVFFACKKNNDTVPQQTDNPPATLNPFAIRANWVVTDFMMNGVDETPDFSGSTLVFSPDNTFAIYNDIMAEDGKWSFENRTGNIVYLQLDFNSETISNDTWRNVADVWKVKTLDANFLVLESTTSAKMLTLQKLAR